MSTQPPDPTPVTSFLIRLGEEEGVREAWRNGDEGALRNLLAENSITDETQQQALLDARETWDFSNVRGIVAREQDQASEQERRPDYVIHGFPI